MQLPLFCRHAQLSVLVHFLRLLHMRRRRWDMDASRPSLHVFGVVLGLLHDLLLAWLCHAVAMSS